jgi:hypothetical protein
MAYFTEREHGPRPRTSEEITLPIAKGILALISDRIRNGSFGYKYPDLCPDPGHEAAVIGTDEQKLQEAVGCLFQDLQWPLRAEEIAGNFVGIDLVEFTFKKIARPISSDRWSDHESFKGHRHLSFDPDTGRQEFRADVNELCSRSGLAFSLEDNGQMIRLAPPLLRETLASSLFHSGDIQLDALLEAARSKFLSCNPEARREGMEKLWDAFERTKTLEPGDKPASIAALLARAVPEPNLRARLDVELRELTLIGNKFMIRHTEVGATPIEDSKHVDYLFHRLFCAIQLLLRGSGRM